jgi:CHASE2 domain-containing sensor protein
MEQVSAHSVSKPARRTKSIRSILMDPSALSVLILVGLWNFSVSPSLSRRIPEGTGFFRETAREIRDVNLHLQLRFYQFLIRTRSIPMKAKNVSVVNIDDDEHWIALAGAQPTDRTFLASLIKNAALSKPAPIAIGIDIQLLAPRHYPDGSDAFVRKNENEDLWQALHFAALQNIPVILASVFYTNKDNEKIQLPNIFSEASLATGLGIDCNKFTCPVYGFINLPDDKREIPLTQEVKLQGQKHQAAHEIDSFALAIAKAAGTPSYPFETPANPFKFLLDDALDGTFLKEGSYSPEQGVPKKINVSDLAAGKPAAIDACQKRIILIGGRWHDLQGYGEPIDEHLSPVGRISGLELHANYIESLLQNYYTHELKVWVDILIDLLVGLIIFVCFELSSPWWQQLGVLVAAFLIPILCAYLFLNLANIFLDFLLPIELYFLHILYELMERHFSWKEKQSHG